jgi:hypothetical protein
MRWCPRQPWDIIFYNGGRFAKSQEGDCSLVSHTRIDAGGINITGYPDSFFNGRICHYAICQSGDDPTIPTDRIAEGTISLTSGSGISKVENLEADQYNIYVAVDADSNGFTYSGGYPADGDLHDAETNITVNDIVIDKYLTLKAVAGEITWSTASSGDLDVAIGTHDPGPPKSFIIERDVTYSGITNATSATYCINVTDLSGSYYLLGGLGSMMGWYDDANGFTGPPPTPPVDLDNLEDSYDFDL